jgi:CubicO group peptidase (beta-lactamase class C family)
MLLVEQGKIGLRDKIEKFFPASKDRPNGEKTIEQLLTHTAGIPAWYPLYIIPPEKRLDFLVRAKARAGRVNYSCLGYIILSQIIERVTGTTLDSLCRESIFDRLDLRKTMFCPDLPLKTIAPTEFGNAHERNKAAAFGDVSSVKWRKRLIHGEAHDGNCFYGFNGVSGNAGLFSNAEDLIALMRYYWSGAIVKKSTLMNMISDHTGGPEPRGLGWHVNPYPHSLSAKAFGHTGFTGAMVAVDPKPGLIIILLANSVHPKVRLGIMPGIRKKIVRLIADAGLSR